MAGQAGGGGVEQVAPWKARLGRKRLLLLAPMLLVGCNATQGPLKSNAPAATPGGTPTPQARQALAPPQAGAPAAGKPVAEPLISLLTSLEGTLRPLTAPGTPPLATRPQANLMALMSKGKVNGQELLTELTAMRQLMRQRKSAAAVGALIGSLDQAAAAGGKGMSFNMKDVLLTQGLRVMENMLKEYVTTIGLQALDEHLRSISDDPQALARETIQMPPSAGMSQAQAQRAVTMAAIVVATRITGRVLKKAQQDFAGVENDFAKLIERREKATTVLYDVLLRGADGSGAAALAGVYDAKEAEYLKATVSKMTVREFSNDMAAQTLALKYLEKNDPAAYADYKAQSDGLMARTKGYLRTAGGVAAFSALVATFAQETIGALRGKQGNEIAALLPLAAEFVTEVPPLLKVAYEATAGGLLPVVKPTKRFRLQDGTKTEELARAKDVFAALEARQADGRMSEAMFRDGSAGLLYKVFSCDKVEAGRLLDTAVPSGEREGFGTKYLSPERVRFSFVNAFQEPGNDRRELTLGEDLLARDHRERTPDATMSLSDVQKIVSRNYARWNDEQLLKLILANREGSAANAALQLGDVTIRPIPSMETIVAYESLVDGCRKAMAAPPPPAAAPAAAPAPGAKPAPAKPAPKPAPTKRPAT